MGLRVGGALLAAALAAAAATSLTADCASPTALAPFWRSVGYTPAEYALRADELENTALIGATPNRGVTQVRIHYLMDLVTVTGWAPAPLAPSGWALSYAWGALDHALDFLVSSNLSPGFEFMGSPTGLPGLPFYFFNTYNGNGHLSGAETCALWRQVVADLLARYIARYGRAEVEAWHLEAWNEPDQGWGWPHPANLTDPVLDGYVAYWDATAAGIEDAEAATGARLYFGGTASGKAAGDKYFLVRVLDHKVANVNAANGKAVRWDYLSAHVKGESTSYVTVLGEWAVSALVRSKPQWAAAAAALPLSNDEGDPMVGWESPEDWRGDARYAAIMPKMVNQHLLAIADNATANNPLGWLSFDGAFLNGASDNYTGFGMRTMTARFGAPAADARTAFVRKNGLAAFTLLSFLGDARCAVAGSATAATVLMANAGALATVRAAGADAAQASLLLYNSADCAADAAPAVDVAASLTGLPLAPAPADGSVVAVLYTLAETPAQSPAATWAAQGAPAVPSAAQLAALWAAAAAMAAAAQPPLPVAVGAGGAVALPTVTLPLPGLALWHIAERASAPAAPAAPARPVAYAKAAAASFFPPSQAEVLLRWDCTTVSRVIARYTVQHSVDGAAWATVNAPPFPADIMCVFAHIAPAGPAFYRVAATDYWNRTGAWSVVAAAAPWPAFEQ
jgi:L-iduronidase